MLHAMPGFACISRRLHALGHNAWHCLSLVQVNQLTEGPLFVRVHDETTLQEVQADIAAQIGECCVRRSRGCVVPRGAHAHQAICAAQLLAALVTA